MLSLIRLGRDDVLKDTWSIFNTQYAGDLLCQWKRVYSIGKHHVSVARHDESIRGIDHNLIQVSVSVPVTHNRQVIIWGKTFSIRNPPKIKWWQFDNGTVYRSLDEVILEARKWAEKRAGVTADIEEKVEEITRELRLREKAFKQVRKDLTTPDEEMLPLKI